MPKAKSKVVKKNPVGAPRSVSLPADEMIALGEEMIKWVKENDPLHLSAWYSIEKSFTDKQWDTMQQMPEFFPYYEKALKIVGMKYLDKNSNVRDGISQRWQRVYFKDLKREEDETKRFEASLKNAEPDPISKDAIDAMTGFFKQVADAKQKAS